MEGPALAPGAPGLVAHWGPCHGAPLLSRGAGALWVAPSAPPSGSPSLSDPVDILASAPLPTLVALAAVLRHFGGV